jgi:hypothetical protein
MRKSLQTCREPIWNYHQFGRAEIFESTWGIQFTLIPAYSDYAGLSKMLMFWTFQLWNIAQKYIMPKNWEFRHSNVTIPSWSSGQSHLEINYNVTSACEQHQTTTWRSEVNLRLVEGEKNLLLLGIEHLCMLIQHQVQTVQHKMPELPCYWLTNEFSVLWKQSPKSCIGEWYLGHFWHLILTPLVHKRTERPKIC